MKVCKVMGTAVSTIKLEVLTGHKLLLVQQLSLAGKSVGSPMLAVDLVGAGLNDVVAVSEGPSVQKIGALSNTPVDVAIIGILDSIKLESTGLNFKD